MAGSEYRKIGKYVIKAECMAPLHVGSAVGEKNEVLVHPVTGEPYLQASGIAGVLRCLSEDVNGEDVTKQLFGTSGDGTAADAGSRIRVSDGIFEKSTLKMELRPRVHIDPESGSVEAGQKKGSGRATGFKFEMESVGKGAVFTFSLYLFDENLREAVEKMLGEIAKGFVQFGGQKSNGHGFIKPREVRYAQYDLTSAERRKAWGSEDPSDVSGTRDITKDLLSSGMNQAYELELFGKTEGSLLVRGIAVSGVGKDAPDAENIRNAAGEFIVPGSSLKGAIRSRMEVIATYLGRQDLIEESFGSQEKAGNLVVQDAVVGNREEKGVIQHRIHIDKFTGGVMNGGLFSERCVSGPCVLHFLVKDKNDCHGTAGLVILALRDLATGVMNLGSGYNVGRGFISAEKLVIRKKGCSGEAVIDFAGGKVSDSEGIIKACLGAVKAGGEK